MAELYQYRPYFSPDYDTQIRDIIPYYDSIHEETINLIKATGINPNLWLDTGCGTGSLIEKAIYDFPNTKFMLGDPSDEMLNVAKKKLSNYSDRVLFLEPTTTQNISIDKLGYLNVITAILSHHYLSMDERIKATDVCYKLLSSGGIYVTYETIRPITEKGLKIFERYWENFQVSRGRDIKTVSNNIKRFDIEYHPISMEAHFSLLQDCGFKIVELFWYSYMQAGFYCVK